MRVHTRSCRRKTCFYHYNAGQRDQSAPTSRFSRQSASSDKGKPIEPLSLLGFVPFNLVTELRQRE